MTVFGQKLQSEEHAERSMQCRQVVSEIMNFGVTQGQIWHIVYLLGLELEDVEDMKALTAFVKERKGREIFLTMRGDE
jgi:hypothetical protein